MKVWQEKSGHLCSPDAKLSQYFIRSVLVVFRLVSKKNRDMLSIRSDVYTEVNIKLQYFGGVPQLSLVDGCQCFGGPYYLHHQMKAVAFDSPKCQ